MDDFTRQEGQAATAEHIHGDCCVIQKQWYSKLGCGWERLIIEPRSLSFCQQYIHSLAGADTHPDSYRITCLNTKKVVG